MPIPGAKVNETRQKFKGMKLDRSSHEFTITKKTRKLSSFADVENAEIRK